MCVGYWVSHSDEILWLCYGVRCIFLASATATLISIFTQVIQFVVVRLQQREVRDLCDERVLFFQSLQESEQKTAAPAASQ